MNSDEVNEVKNEEVPEVVNNEINEESARRSNSRNRNV